MAPIDVPAISVGRTPASSSASSTGIWAKPWAAPPPSASPTRAPPGGAASGFRLSDADDNEVIAAEEPFGDPPDIVDGHCLDQSVPAVDIVDAEIVELDGEKLPGGSCRCREVHRVAADEVAFGMGKLIRRRAIGGEALD